MAGELQLGGTTLATHTGSGASAKINLDSGLVFPAGVVIDVNFYQELTNSGSQTADYGWGTVRSVSLTSGQKCLIDISGGGLLSADATTYGYAAIQYDTSTLTTSSQGSFAYGGQSYVDDVTVSANNPRIIVGQTAVHLYTAGSNVTLYFRPAVHTTGSTVAWNAGSDRPINIAVWKIA